MRLAKLTWRFQFWSRFYSLGSTVMPSPISLRINIPSNLSAEVKAEVEGLYSPEALKRAQAANKLGNMGEKAVPAIPLLIGMLGDSAGIEFKDRP